MGISEQTFYRWKKHFAGLGIVRQSGDPQSDWKLLNFLKGAGGTGSLELFNLKDDPAEMHDLSAKCPENRDAMLKLRDE